MASETATYPLPAQTSTGTPAAPLSTLASVTDNTTAEPFDYSYVHTTARIAVYDDLKAAPRIVEVQPAPTRDYIETLTSTVYDLAKQQGSVIPYTVIREVSENFIHARFSEIVVSILSSGNTIRFADQGPGIASKDKAQLPGFTSATQEMKPYIRGVGSGLPIVREFLQSSSGRISIEDNLVAGAVVTISMGESQSLVRHSQAPQQVSAALVPILTDRQKDLLRLFLREGSLGVTDLNRLTNQPQSTIYVALTKLEEEGLLEKTVGKKRSLTDFGYQVAQSL